jgi:hypothetical protein
MRSIKRLTTILLAAITLVAAHSLFAQSPTRLVKFSNSFAANPSPLWNNYTGNWTAAGGQYYAQAPNDSPLTYTGLPFVVTDYILTVTTVVGDGGIWLRSDENSPYGNYLLLVLGGDNYGQGGRGGKAGTSLYFATPTESSSQVENVFTPGVAYTITVTAKGNTYSVYINGATTPVATYVDTKLQFPSGQVGLYDDQPNTTTGSGSGTPTSFSNFSLSAVAVPPLITSLSPAAAKPGSTVTIKGTNLQEATAVTFNGTAAQFTQIYPSAEIVAVVPALSTTGPIEVLTALGATGVFTVLP